VLTTSLFPNLVLTTSLLPNRVLTTSLAPNLVLTTRLVLGVLLYKTVTPSHLVPVGSFPLPLDIFFCKCGSESTARLEADNLCCLNVCFASSFLPS
jgi:hypothetical protein